MGSNLPRLFKRRLLLLLFIKKMKKTLENACKIGLAYGLLLIGSSSFSNTLYDMTMTYQYAKKATERNEEKIDRGFIHNIQPTIASMDMNHYWGTRNNAELTKYHAIRSLTGVVGTVGSFYLFGLSLNYLNSNKRSRKKESELE